MPNYRTGAYADRVGVFVLRSGSLGFRCACGYLAFGRSLSALELALADHQDVIVCPVARHAADDERDEA